MGSEGTKHTIQELIDKGIITAHKDGNYGAMYPRQSEFGDTGVLFLTAKLVSDQGFIDFENAPRLSHEKAKKLTFGYIESKDVLLSHNATVGRVAITPELTELVLVGTSLTYFRTDSARLLPEYFAAYLSGVDFQNELKAVMGLSTRNQVPITAQRKLEVVIPPLPEQKAIAHILGTLDDKIELNRRMNATLEGMAQALFKSWFVDFDPVIDNAIATGNPIPDELAARAEVRRQALANGTANREAAKPFPAAFQQTEESGWMPAGWKMKAFNILAKLDTTSVKPFEQPDTLWEHYSIPSYDATGMPSWDHGDEIKSNKYLVKPGAILSSKLNPETERTWWPFMMDEKTSICSTEFMQFVPHKKEEQAFVYSLIRSDPFQANILERVTGSTGSRQRAQPKQIAEIEVIDCGELLRAEFIKIALPLFQSIRNNSLRTQTLTKLRDTLLPKLISGELRIPEAEQLTEKALA